MRKCGLSEARRPNSTPDKRVMTIRFLCMYKPSKPEGTPPTEQEIKKMSTLSEESIKSGAWVATKGVSAEREGCARTTVGRKVQCDRRAIHLVQRVGGFALIRRKPGEEAIEYSKDFLKSGRRRDGHSSDLRRAGHSFAFLSGDQHAYDHEGLLQQWLSELEKK